MLITPEDLDRLARLEIEREGDHDVVWACKLARKLAWIKPMEAEFQQYLALINTSSCSAYTLRHDETLSLQQSDSAISGAPKFLHQFSCSEKDAFLCVRPYVILEGHKFQETIEALEKYGKWKATVGGESIASGRLAEILVGLDGYGVRRKPYIFPMPRDHVDNVFTVGRLEPTRPLDTFGGSSVSPAPFGVFLGTGAKLEIILDVPNLTEANLLIGVVAARYTTKASTAALPAGSVI